MARDEEGFSVRIALPPGRTYRFRYLLDDGRWENDWAADAYVPNEFGGGRLGRRPDRRPSSGRRRATIPSRRRPPHGIENDSCGVTGAT